MVEDVGQLLGQALDARDRQVQLLKLAQVVQRGVLGGAVVVDFDAQLLQQQGGMGWLLGT